MTTTAKVTTLDNPNQAPTSFRLKGGLFPLTLLELIHFDKALLRDDLQKKVTQAPEFFQQVPVILCTEHYEDDPALINLAELRTMCIKFGLLLVALRSSDEVLRKKALQLGIGLIAGGRKAKNKSSERARDPASGVTAVTLNDKVITTPIRSGQQVYASGGSLIVLASVSAGAEILADGSIHVYGAMRGRALAGVQGDTSARIFCQSLEAELISISGRFTTEEHVNSPYWKQAVQIHMISESLHIEPLLYQPR